MSNNKKLQNIQGTETISSTWRRLLDRDRNISNLFSGTDFTTDQNEDDVGRPVWRSDQKRIFIWEGQQIGWTNLFTYISPSEISYSINHPDVPSSVDDVKDALDLIVHRNNLNTITMPAESVTYTADGNTSTYLLPRYTSNKNTLFIFIDGVKQEVSTYSLSNDGLSVIFEVNPSRNEQIEIVQNASLAEWDYSPSIQYFVGDGNTKTFTLSFDALSSNTTSVNVDGVELQKNQFTVSGRTIQLNDAPANGSSIQITTIGKTSFVTASAGSIGTNQLQNGCVTGEKLASNIPVNVNSIADNSITTRMIGNGNITSAKIADSAITNDKINNGTIAEGKLATSVREKLLGANTISTSMVQDSSITQAKLAPGVFGNYYTKAEVDALINQLRQELGS